jgi:hypothetical protein
MQKRVLLPDLQAGEASRLLAGVASAGLPIVQRRQQQVGVLLHIGTHFLQLESARKAQGTRGMRASRAAVEHV